MKNKKNEEDTLQRGFMILNNLQLSEKSFMYPQCRKYNSIVINHAFCKKNTLQRVCNTLCFSCCGLTEMNTY